MGSQQWLPTRFWLNPMQCLLQECTDFVQLYKEIGRGLEGLVDCAGVFAVDGELLQPPNEAVEECECLVVYIVDADAVFTFL